jgi:hypothetical protein
MPDHGPLPDVNIHYTIPPDEKQIVASLRTLQRDLNEAVQTINSLTRERDEAIHELKLLRMASKKQQASPAQQRRTSSRVEEELFDISRSITPEQPQPARRSFSSRRSLDAPKTTISDEARVLSPVNVNKVVATKSHDNAKSKVSQKTVAQDTENSMIDDPTAASNTSRRRRHTSLDENMTSAYILPDITVSQPAAQKPTKPSVSHAARQVLHRHGDPDHVDDCTICQRLTAPARRVKHQHISRTTRTTSAPAPDTHPSHSLPEHTEQLTRIIKDMHLDSNTIRPKMPPHLALANVKNLLQSQFEEAKQQHGAAWEVYDGIDAPRSSKRHASVAEELNRWRVKMEECRVYLDQVRDIEEGMRGQGDE